MTSDNAMDPANLTIGRDRTIMHLQQQIRLLRSMLAMAHGIILENPTNALHRGALQEIEKVLNHE